jgi:hypothetical protein
MELFSGQVESTKNLFTLSAWYARECVYVFVHIVDEKIKINLLQNQFSMSVNQSFF